MAVVDPAFLSMSTTCKYNILIQIVNDPPPALIADFGLAMITGNPDSIQPATRQPYNIALWIAREVLEVDNPTKESYIYLFAVVMIEVREG